MRCTTLVVSLGVRAKVDLELAATAIAAGDAQDAGATVRVRVLRTRSAVLNEGTRVIAVVEATHGPTGGGADDVWLGAADLAGCIFFTRKALAGLAVAVLPARAPSVRVVGTRLGSCAPRGDSEERTTEQRTPGRAAGSGGPEKAGHSVKSLMVHRADPPQRMRQGMLIHRHGELCLFPGDGRDHGSHDALMTESRTRGVV